MDTIDVRETMLLPNMLISNLPNKYTREFEQFLADSLKLNKKRCLVVYEILKCFKYKESGENNQMLYGIRMRIRKIYQVSLYTGFAEHG